MRRTRGDLDQVAHPYSGDANPVGQVQQQIHYMTTGQDLSLSGQGLLLIFYSGWAFLQALSNFVLFIYFGCTGSLLLHMDFVQLRRMGATLRCCVQAFHCSSFFCWRAQRASWLPELGHAGLVAPGHVKSSQTRDQSCVPCVLTIGPPGKSSFRLCIWKNVQCTEKLQEQYGKVVRFTNCYHMVFPVVMY